MSGIEICLLCHEPPTAENMEVRRLANSLCLQGHTVRLEVTSARHEVSAAIDRAIQANPSVLHFNIRYPDNYLMDLAFADVARKRGYRGYITCSGSAAALSAGWVLEKIPAVDAVIPHNADRILHQLINVLKEGKTPDELTALRTRRNPSPTRLEAAEPVWRPLRGDPPEILGVRTAALASVDGCASGCAYCIHAAIAEQERASLAPTGNPAARHCLPNRRPLPDLVDEMAQLFHDDGVRHFTFTDDNPLPAFEKSALAWLYDFKAQLGRRRVRNISLGMNTRGDRLTPVITDSLVSLGLVRTLMGVESSNDEGLRSMGRLGNASAGIDSMQRLASKGVLVWFNSIFLRPDSSFDSIRRELQFLSTVPHALFNTIKLRPFSGTALEKRLSAAGLLNGGPDFRDYGFSDPRLVRFNRDLYRFQFEAARTYDPALRLHDLLLSATLAERHRKIRHSGVLRQRLRDSVVDVNRMRILTLEQLLYAAQNGRDAEEIIQNAVFEFAQLHSRLDDFGRQLERQYSGRVSTHYGHVAAAAALLFTLSGQGGCANVGDSEDPSVDSVGESDSESSSETETGTAGGTDIGTDADADTDTDVDSDTNSETDSNDTDCSRSELGEILNADCGRSYNDGGLIVTVDSAGQVTGIRYCNSTNPLAPEVLDCMMNLLQDERFPCLADQDIAYCIIAIE